MLDWDPKGKLGPTTPLPDLVTIHPPKEEEEYMRAITAMSAPAPAVADIEIPAPLAVPV